MKERERKKERTKKNLFYGHETSVATFPTSRNENEIYVKKLDFM